MVTHDWFVCPTVSMVTTSHATGLEKTLLQNFLSRSVQQLHSLLQRFPFPVPLSVPDLL